jgi:endonuclease III
MRHINNHYLRVDDVEMKRILKMITINKDKDLEEVKDRIEQVLGMKEDPIDKFHATIAYYNNEV